MVTVIRKTRHAGPKTASTAPAAPELGETAARHTLAVNPLIGVRAEDLGQAAKTFAKAVAHRPARAARHLGAYARELWRVGKGESTLSADPKDRRFADPAWSSSGVHERLLKAYLAAGQELNRFIDSTELDAVNKERVRLVTSIGLDALSPSNTLLNPTALKRIVDTGGKSLFDGARHLLDDLRHNQGLPSSVDKSAFEMGRNICTTPGSVVFRNDVLELIQYQPRTDRVYQRPLLITPPQVNKFYALDLAPEKSLIKFALDQGLQPFAVSWRNPTKAHRDWDMGTYVRALDEAVDAALQITGADAASMWGACSGGMTMASYLGWLAARGQRKVVSVVTPVCVLDATLAMDSTMGLFCTPQSLKAVKTTIRRKGVVDGAEMARVFAWLRPNDLIWNYWVNNYLLGHKPPAFDVLYWNADTTRLPADFHADLLDIMERSPFTHPGTMEIDGHAIDMRNVQVDAYAIDSIKKNGPDAPVEDNSGG